MDDPGYSYVSLLNRPYCPSFSPCDLSLNEGKCLLGADRELVMIPVLSPWPRYRGHRALMLLAPVSRVFSLAPLMQNSNNSNSILFLIIKPRCQCRPLFSVFSKISASSWGLMPIQGWLLHPGRTDSIVLASQPHASSLLSISC